MAYPPSPIHKSPSGTDTVASILASSLLIILPGPDTAIPEVVSILISNGPGSRRKHVFSFKLYLNS